MQAFWGLVVLVGMVVAVVSLIGLIWATLRKNDRRRWMTAILAGSAMFIVGMVFAVKTPVPASEQEKAAAAPVQKATSAAAPIAVPVATSPAPIVPQGSPVLPELTPETVLQLSSSGVSVPGAIKITKDNTVKIDVLKNVPNQGDNTVSVYFKPGAVWDETDLVKGVGGGIIAASSGIFSNQSINRVVFFAQAEMTDQYGKASTQTVVKVDLSRSLADKIDWKGLADRHLTDPGNIYRIADYYKISPGIKGRIDSGKVKLK